ncbi:MAG TPA: transglycosylase SLT domain-containing protein [Bryobacteraceae bacterium]|nr:transglycosylase SLT domain-containing protein [Bryobacteraceae bacterium]
MTIRKFSARIIPVPCFSLVGLALVAWHLEATSAKNAPPTLAALVRAERESPTPARRAAVEAYADTHAHEPSGALARLALGVIAYEQQNYAAALTDLNKVGGKLPKIADYVAYYEAASRVESNELAGVEQELAAAHPPALSPLAGRAWLLEGRALKTTNPAEAVRRLREHYAELPQPEGDVVLADACLAAGDPAHAADFYQRVYFRYVSGDPAGRAAAALIELQQSMGPAYPQPLAAQKLQRADRLLEAGEFPDARAAYQELAIELPGLAREQARVRLGVTDFRAGNTANAYPYLRGLELMEPEADAERLFYLEECARRLTDDDEMLGALERLKTTYPRSPWRLRALTAVASHFLAANRPGDYIPLYRAVYQDFPGEAQAAVSHWRVTFQAYLQHANDADDLLREHLRQYPGHATAGAALYFLARSAEANNDLGAASTFYSRLSQMLPNTYYGLLARNRLERSEIRSAQPSAEAAAFLETLRWPEAKPVPASATGATTLRIERSRLLRTAGLNDLADSELRFGARTDGQPALLAMEMASAADAPYQGLHMMKSLSSDYLNLPLDRAPMKYWELLFPLPYRGALVANARAHDLDPYLVAGLIRQESEFNPQALSRANAYGLTQVRPSTGKLYAQRAGVLRFTNRVLFEPVTNLKIGTTVLRSMLDDNGGNLEQTLASYNAGPNRAAEWVSWKMYREPAEFVESIPFTETRDYVQAVLRNADIYRRLYSGRAF